MSDNKRNIFAVFFLKINKLNNLSQIKKQFPKVFIKYAAFIQTIPIIKSEDGFTFSYHGRSKLSVNIWAKD